MTDKTETRPVGMTYEAFINYQGEIIQKSGAFATGMKPNAAKLVAVMCYEEGLTLRGFLRTYHVTSDGDISMRADAMLAGLVSQGGSYDILRRDHEASSLVVKIGDREKQFTTTWDELKNEPFTKGRGGKYKANYATLRPRMQMLWARTVSDAVRTMAPMVVAGYYTPEEMADVRGDLEFLPQDTMGVGDSATTATAGDLPAATTPPPIQLESTATQARELLRLIKILQLGDRQEELLERVQPGAKAIRNLTFENNSKLIAKLLSAAGKKMIVLEDYDENGDLKTATQISGQSPIASATVDKIAGLLGEMTEAGLNGPSFGLKHLQELGKAKIRELTKAQGQELIVKIHEALLFSRTPDRHPAADFKPWCRGRRVGGAGCAGLSALDDSPRKPRPFHCHHSTF